MLKMEPYPQLRPLYSVPPNHPNLNNDVFNTDATLKAHIVLAVTPIAELISKIELKKVCSKNSTKNNFANNDKPHIQ